MDENGKNGLEKMPVVCNLLYSGKTANKMSAPVIRQDEQFVYDGVTWSIQEINENRSKTEVPQLTIVAVENEAVTGVWK